MPILKAGDTVQDIKYGTGRVIYIKKDNALVEYVKTAPNQLMPGVWSIKRKMTINKHDGTKKRVLDPSSFGHEDACMWYDRLHNNLEVVLYPHKVKKEVKQSIVGNNNIQAAGDIVVAKA
jgi:hypothetical protein